MATVFTPLGKRKDAKHKGVLIWDFEDYHRLKTFGINPRLSRVTRKGRKTLLYSRFRFNNKDIRLHNFIMWSPDGFEIDHINGNGLDNRKKNLRIVTSSENNMNRDSNRIYFDKSRNKWKLRIYKNYNLVFSKRYENKVDAITDKKIMEKRFYPTIFGKEI